MTDAPLTRPADRYVAGMREELKALTALRTVADAQCRAARPESGEDLATLVAQRLRIEEALDSLERVLQPIRASLPARDVRGAAAPEIDTLHDQARALVAAILEIDRETLALLHVAVASRPARVQQLDAGEATLAAYRRTLAPTTPSKELIDQVG